MKPAPTADRSRRRAAQPRGGRRRRRCRSRPCSCFGVWPGGLLDLAATSAAHAHADGPAVRRTVTAARVAMNVPKSIFRQYDVRGLVDDELTPEFARGARPRLRAASAWERVGRAPVLAVGRDNRPSGPALAAGRAPRHRRGRRHGGGRRHAADAGALLRRLRARRPTAASRSPARTIRPSSTASRWCSAGEAFHGEEILELWEIIVAERWRSGQGRETTDGSVLRRYREAIVSRHQLERPVRVVVRLRQRRRQPHRRLHARRRSAPR